MSEPMHVVQFRLSVEEYRMVADQASGLEQSVASHSRALVLSAARRSALLGPLGETGDAHVEAASGAVPALAALPGDFVPVANGQRVETPQVPDQIVEPEVERVLVEPKPARGADKCLHPVGRRTKDGYCYACETRIGKTRNS